MSEPLHHVERPRLPWQTEFLTECGRGVGDFRDGIVLGKDAVQALIAKHGQQRTYMMCCVTCLSRAQYSPDTWESNPSAVMARHCERSVYRRWTTDADAPINMELRALALLVEAHRDEYEQAIHDLTSAVPIAHRRRRNRSARSEGTGDTRP